MVGANAVLIANNAKHLSPEAAAIMAVGLWGFIIWFAWTLYRGR